MVPVTSLPQLALLRFYQSRITGSEIGEYLMDADSVMSSGSMHVFKHRSHFRVYDRRIRRDDSLGPGVPVRTERSCAGVLINPIYFLAPLEETSFRELPALTSFNHAFKRHAVDSRREETRALWAVSSSPANTPLLLPRVYSVEYEYIPILIVYVLRAVQIRDKISRGVLQAARFKATPP